MIDRIHTPPDTPAEGIPPESSDSFPPQPATPVSGDPPPSGYDPDELADDPAESMPQALKEFLTASNGHAAPLYFTYIHQAGTAVTGSHVQGGVHTTTTAATGYPPRVRTGVVRPEELDFVERHFAEPPEYHKALTRLRDGLLLLVGRPGSGRRTTAMHLLIDCAVRKVVALEPDDLTRLSSLTFRAGIGYLLDLSDLTLLAQAYDPARIDALVHALREAGARLVITAPTGDGASPSGWQTYVCETTAPSPIAVVSEYLDEELGREWRAEHPGLVDDDVRVVIEGCRGPSEAASLAFDLVGVACGRHDKERLLADSGAKGRKAVADWFANRTDPAAWAFTLATAVFEGHDYSVVAERARVLSSHLRRVDGFGHASSTAPATQGMEAVAPTSTTPSHLPHVPPASVSRTTWLKDIDAHVTIGDTVEVRHSIRYRIEPVSFVRLHWADSVLTHVWREYPALREALMAWLADTPTRRGLHVVAGLRAGRLLGATHGHRPLAPLSEWAKRDRPRREMAACALGAAAEDEITATQVRRRLTEWSRPDARADLRLTAALTYGGTFGVSYPEPALRRLVKLAAMPEPDVAAAAQEGIVQLCRVAIAPVEVIRYLRTWVEGGNGDRTTAGGIASVLLTGAPDRNRGLPSEVAELLNDPEGRGETVSLLRALCADEQAYPTVMDVISVWLRGTATRGDWTGVGGLITAVLEEMFAGSRRAGLERLAYDLVSLAYSGDDIDIDALQPAIRAFEDPMPLRRTGDAR